MARGRPGGNPANASALVDEDLGLAIGRLQRRRDEVRGIASDISAPDDPRVNGAELNIASELGAVFGLQSVEFKQNEHYANAVLNAGIALVNYVKEKSGRHDLDGAGLMTTVFSKNAPVLAFNDLTDKTDQDEQEGLMHLFVGAVQALRNPRAHTLAPDSPEDALEAIAFFSFLAKRLDRTKRTRGTP